MSDTTLLFLAALNVSTALWLRWLATVTRAPRIVVPLLVIDVAFAVVKAAAGEPVMAAGNAAAAAILGHYLWTNRRRKDRRPSRVAGVVRNLGHRLAVVPVPTGQQS